jgi:hypothetical protein
MRDYGHERVVVARCPRVKGNTNFPLDIRLWKNVRLLVKQWWMFTNLEHMLRSLN